MINTGVQPAPCTCSRHMYDLAMRLRRCTLESVAALTAGDGVALQLMHAVGATYALLATGVQNTQTTCTWRPQHLCNSSCNDVVHSQLHAQVTANQSIWKPSTSVRIAMQHCLNSNRHAPFECIYYPCMHGWKNRISWIHLFNTASSSAHSIGLPGLES